jgi:hypothetical protein
MDPSCGYAEYPFVAEFCDSVVPYRDRRHGGIVGLVEEMLALQERLGPLRGLPSEERAELERRVAQVDRDIDEAVYKLYGLTAAERRLVEGDAEALSTEAFPPTGLPP